MSFAKPEAEEAASREGSLFCGRVVLRQSAGGHRAGTDAVLLAAGAPVVDGLIIDAGAGSGAVGIAAALRAPQARLELLDSDPTACALAIENAALNGLADRVRVAHVDLLSAKSRHAAGIAAGQAELVLTNPPFYDQRQVRVTPDAAKARAHVFSGKGDETIEGWMRMIASLGAPDSRMVMIHRADQLRHLLAACDTRFGDIAILPIYPRRNTPATRILIGARKDSRAPLRILAGLIMHEDQGNGFTPQAQAIHRGEASLSLF